MFDGAEFGHPDACVFGIFAHEPNSPYADQYVLGVPFLENYYTIFDNDNKRVGIALHIYSDAAIRQTFSWWAILLLALGVMVVFPLIVLGLYMIYKVRRNKRRALEGSTIESQAQVTNKNTEVLLQKLNEEQDQQ